VEGSPKCPNKTGDLLGMLPTVSTDVLIGCEKMKKPCEKAASQ
jgi:hypothetical protein